MKIMNPIHPGEILKHEFLLPSGLSENSFAELIGVTEDEIYQLVTGKTGINANLALRFSDYFQNSAEFWMNLQTRYDLEVEKDRARVR